MESKSLFCHPREYGRYGIEAFIEARAILDA